MTRFNFALRTLIGPVILRTLLFGALWWILTEGQVGALWLAACVVAVSVAASIQAWPPRRGGIPFVGLAAYLAFFLWQSLRGGLAVANLALRPRLALRPCVRLLPLRLPPGAGRVLLANTMSLLPGTLSVGLEGDSLRLHVLDQALFREADLRAAEDRVARLLKGA